MRTEITFLFSWLMSFITALWPDAVLSLGVWMQWSWPGAVRASWKVHKPAWKLAGFKLKPRTYATDCWRIRSGNVTDRYGWDGGGDQLQRGRLCRVLERCWLSVHWVVGQDTLCLTLT